ncbi:DUF697 domain-containing protein [Leptolyngbya sp. FACHB-261]|uniref:DUF697 domain-containing protein n=1 Tax=Leptolyngbya sp. FACHB-261 TaxID=2692806 RepID=UPI0016850BF1|nr:DUF697 domain-containing protein [Leptolyngbya sp. FACHB-261]MBD2101811.1 DUF697 domain-containing protein [Leptolyngbya sp. FACHB-261]
MSAPAPSPFVQGRWLGSGLVLVGGVALLGDWFASDLILNIWGSLSLLALVLGGYFWLRDSKPETVPRGGALVLSTAAVEQEVCRAETLAHKLEATTAEQLCAQATAIRAELTRSELRIGVAGPAKSGKSSLIAALAPNSQGVAWLEETTETTPISIPSPDLLLFVTAGDLSASEFQRLNDLSAGNRPTVLVLNQSDRYQPADQDEVLAHLRELSQTLPSVQTVVSVAAAPNPVKVRQHHADGSVREWFEEAKPEIATLQTYLAPLLSQESERLKLGNALQQAQSLRLTAQDRLNQVRRSQAQVVIERYQWLTAAAVFANPLPGLDLLATAAINAQMLLEIAAIYERPLSLQQAQPLAKTLGVLMLKLGLVELSTQGISALLKSNVATYAVGGVMQGLSAAYLSHLGALSFMTCLEQEQDCTERTLGQKLQELFAQNQRTAFLQGFVKQGISHLLGEQKQPQLESA